MAETQTTTTVNGVAIALTTFNWAGGTLNANAEAITVRDPITALGLSVVAAGAAPANVLGVSTPFQNSSGTGVYIPVPDQQAQINATAGVTTQIIASQTGKRLYVCSLVLIANGTGSGTIQFVQGSGNTAISGLMAMTAETGISVGSGIGAILTTSTGNNLSITTTGIAVQGWALYTYY